MSDEVLVSVEGVSKKYCSSLKRSLWYGVQDVASELLGSKGHHDELRKNEFWAVDARRATQWGDVVKRDLTLRNSHAGSPPNYVFGSAC